MGRRIFWLVVVGGIAYWLYSHRGSVSRGGSSSTSGSPTSYDRDCLMLAEQAHAEDARSAQELVERRLPAHGDPDKRRVERERDERAHGEADPLAFEVDGDDGDAGRKPPHERPQLLARHQKSTKWSNGRSGGV